MDRRIDRGKDIRMDKWKEGSRKPYIGARATDLAKLVTLKLLFVI